MARRESHPCAGDDEADSAPSRIAPPLPPCSIRYFFNGETGVERLLFWLIPPDGATGERAAGLLTVDGLPVTIAPIGGESQLVAQWDPVDGEAYAAPDGRWVATAIGASGSAKLLCGLAGGEFVTTLPTFPIRFVAGSPAFAPAFSPTGGGGPGAAAAGATAVPSGLTSACPISATAVTTSWVAVPMPAGTGGPVGYFSQPRSAGWFGPSGQLLGPTAMLTAPLPFGDGPAGAFPMAPFGGLTQADPECAARFESQVLAPARLNAIYAASWPAAPAPAAPGPRGASGPVTTLVTPQGLRLEVEDGRWRALTLARSGGSSLVMGNVDARLAVAFQAEQLFLVIDKAGIDALVSNKLCDILFDSLNVGGWRFDLSPEHWASDPAPTLLIVKFARADLPTLAGDPSQWTLPGLVTGDAGRAQAVLLEAIEKAKANLDDPDYDYFRDVVLGDWNGILALNVQVPPDAFPKQLVALTAGLSGPLLAHHFGAALAPVQLSGGEPATRDAKLFGLIAVEDDTDLTYHGSAYDFKTLLLRVLFANSAVAAFSSKIELLVGELFGERSQLIGGAHGDNILLTGSMQKHGESDVYSFSQVGPNSFAMQSAVLQSVQLTGAQMQTVAGPSGASGSAPGPSGSSGPTGRAYTALFPLAGTVAFQEQPGLDLFAFGPTGATGPIGPTGASGPDFGAQGLRFSNLVVSMTFTEGDANLSDRRFAFDATQAVLDLPSSQVRPGSLYDGFPLTATGFLQGGPSPTTLGYLPLSTPPLVTGALGPTWFGVAMNLALGTRGGLAGMAPLTASLLTAWAPSAAGSGQPQANSATLAMLPGTKGIRSLGLQGPLKLELGASSIDRTEARPGENAYVMRFNDIALSLFGLRFPSGGRTNVALFGDPSGGRNGSLGWYAAYLKNAPATGGTGGAAAPAGTAAIPRRGAAHD